MSDASTPYTQLGGEEAVRTLAARFYDIMDAEESALAALHPLDEHGKVSSGARERFALFLIGWLGGPQDYIAAHGHPRLRLRHARVPVTLEMRDAWLRCMDRALQECAVPASLLGFLQQRFHELADFLRNTD
jgi:hemoglobin